MKIIIHAKTRASKEEIRKISDTEWIVRTTKKPVDDEANTAIIALVARELGVPKSRIVIRHGLHHSTKMLDVLYDTDAPKGA